jgi:hypothetical protein
MEACIPGGSGTLTVGVLKYGVEALLEDDYGEFP